MPPANRSLWKTGALFASVFLFVVLSHLTLLRLPYFWDEGGYYVPAALDFYRTGTLIPQFTNAHPPLPNVVLGTLYHLFGFHVLVTRLTACAFAALGVSSVILLGAQLLDRPRHVPIAGITLGVLTALYPIWYTQSSLAHADIFAGAFTLAGLALFLPSKDLIGAETETFNENLRVVAAAVCFCLAVLSKETAILQPASLAAVEWLGILRDRPRREGSLRWAWALTTPLPVLAAWYAFHFAKTGQIFGNPTYLHYNATENFTLGHILYGLRIRALHLTWQRNLWVPLVLALAALLFLPPTLTTVRSRTLLALPRPVTERILLLILANLLAFSVLGGALLTRYLLPVYPLLLLICLALWRERTPWWPALTALTAGAFVSALWLNPFAFFAPEDNLTYRDMIVVHQQAIAYLNAHYPQATVLTAWPVAADLTRPDLGYTTHIFRIVTLENFTTPELGRAAQDPGAFDTALVFTTHYASPGFRRYLLAHRNSWRGRHSAEDLDLTPEAIALILGGKVVWHTDRNGEWAAILRFPRSYTAHIDLPAVTAP